MTSGLYEGVRGERQRESRMPPAASTPGPAAPAPASSLAKTNPALPPPPASKPPAPPAAARAPPVPLQIPPQSATASVTSSVLAPTTPVEALTSPRMVAKLLSALSTDDSLAGRSLASTPDAAGDQTREEATAAVLPRRPPIPKTAPPPPPGPPKAATPPTAPAPAPLVAPTPAPPAYRPPTVTARMRALDDLIAVLNAAVQSKATLEVAQNVRAVGTARSPVPERASAQ